MTATSARADPIAVAAFLVRWFIVTSRVPTASPVARLPIGRACGINLSPGASLSEDFALGVSCGCQRCGPLRAYGDSARARTSAPARPYSARAFRGVMDSEAIMALALKLARQSEVPPDSGID